MKSEERERIDLFDRTGRKDAEKERADGFETGEGVRLDDLDGQDAMISESTVDARWVCA